MIVHNYYNSCFHTCPKYNILAVTPMDYYYCTQSTVFIFEACSARNCVKIPIVDDLSLEMEESFSVSLKIIDILDEVDRDSIKLCSGNDNEGDECSRLVDKAIIIINETEGVTLFHLKYMTVCM